MSGKPFSVIIPARYGSTRFPGKPLADLGGRPVLAHVCQRARESGADQVLVATDNSRIAEAARMAGVEVVMTRADHPSGTDRLAEVAADQGWDDDHVVVNLQGDEPFMPGALIAQVARDLQSRGEAEMGTLAVPLSSARDLHNPNIVKVVRRGDGCALYFSRAPIPWDRERAGHASDGSERLNGYLRHLGIYAYRADFLRRYPSLPACELEQVESLEQLRALWHGARIHVGIAEEMPGPGIDTPDDLAEAQKVLGGQG